MKIQKTSQPKNKFIIITTVVLILLIAGGTAYYLYAKNNAAKQSESSSSNKADNTVDYKTPTNNQVQAGNDSKKDFIDKQNTDTTTPPSNNVNISITSDTQSGNIHQIRTMISAKNTDGSCTLAFSRAGQTTITQKAGVQVYPDYAICEGFDIDTSTLAKGDWTATINYIDSNSTGVVSKVISIK